MDNQANANELGQAFEPSQDSTSQADLLPYQLKPKRLMRDVEKSMVMLEIQETMALSMLKDVRVWIANKIPKPGTQRRLNWDKSRQMFVSTFRELFGLNDKPTVDAQSWRAARAVTMDIVATSAPMDKPSAAADSQAASS